MLISRINCDNHTPSVLHPLGEARYLLTLTEGRGGGRGWWEVVGGRGEASIQYLSCLDVPFPIGRLLCTQLHVILDKSFFINTTSLNGKRDSDDLHE